MCTGVGFIGAGVIAKGSRGRKEAEPFVRGVTTACAVWVSASLGILAASGLELLALWATGLAVSILRLSRLYQMVNEQMMPIGEWRPEGQDGATF